MCIALVGRVVGIEPDGAQVQLGEHVRHVCTLLFPDLEPGEFVLVSAGSVMARLSPEDAQERLALFDRLLEVLDESR